jgi:insulysin
MGSEEFPAEGDFHGYIAAHAGMNNGWTISDHTLYTFSILPHGLLAALDRLSQFFISPVCFHYTLLT